MAVSKVFTEQLQCIVNINVSPQRQQVYSLANFCWICPDYALEELGERLKIIH